MYTSSQVETVLAATLPQWTLAPCRSRVERIDLSLRERLGKSLEYIGGVIAGRGATELVGLDGLQRRLTTGAVSPWVFCLYSKLVAELSKRPTGEVAEVFRDVGLAASLPADQGIVAFRDAAIADSWWDHFQVLLDTDPRRRFSLQAPGATIFSRCEQEIGGGLALLVGSDPAFFDELRSLLRMIVLGSPTSSADGFNGASTFFVWGGALLNAEASRSAISVIDLLVHESSHVLLFGLSADGPLTRNSGHERYASPVRADKRPIDGIFHACFVTTRVHLALSRLLGSGSLSAKDASEAAERRQYNGNAARESIDLLEQHALLTEHGEPIFGELRDYWDAAKGP